MSDVRQPYGLEVLRTEDGGVRVVGELDLRTVPTLDEALGQLTTNGQVTLDLSELTFIDSTGIHSLMTFARAAGGTEVVLLNPTDAVRRVLELVGLGDHEHITIR